jgi:hypothetical protein
MPAFPEVTRLHDKDLRAVEEEVACRQHATENHIRTRGELNLAAMEVRNHRSTVGGRS